jgi:predicted negative regulator of RcsB-dependent stress response
LAQRAFDDMKQRFASTSYAPQAGLLVAKVATDSGKDDAGAASAALQWVVDNASDAGLCRAVAALRLSALMLQAQQYEQAKKILESVRAEAFVPLAQDRLGDLYVLQNKQDLAEAAYLKAFADMDTASDYRRLIKIKLNALGCRASCSSWRGLMRQVDMWRSLRSGRLLVVALATLVLGACAGPE